MGGGRGKIIVGVLGQWASGKTSAAKTLIEHLGGDGKVTFLTDRVLLGRQVIKHVLEVQGSTINVNQEPDGRNRIEGELAVVYLAPGEDLDTVDLGNLLFDLHEDVYDKIPLGAPSWLDIVRLQLGADILEAAREEEPIVIEAGFGTNTEPRGENPLSHTLSDLFMRLDEAGVEPGLVRWILVEADFERRSARNRARLDSVPEVEFNRLAADGGDLDPKDQKRLESEGMIIKRVSNNHSDFDKFQGDIIKAFEELFPETK